MPARRRLDNEAVSSEEKIARLLAAIALKDIESQGDKIALLKSAGFQSSEIASMLGITEHHVAVELHRNRTRKRPKRKTSR